MKEFGNIDDAVLWLDQIDEIQRNKLLGRAALRSIPALMVSHEDNTDYQLLEALRFGLQLGLFLGNAKSSKPHHLIYGDIVEADQRYFEIALPSYVVTSNALAILFWGVDGAPKYFDDASRRLTHIKTVLLRALMSTNEPSANYALVSFTDQTVGWRQFCKEANQQMHGDEPLWSPNGVSGSFRQHQNLLIEKLKKFGTTNFWYRFYDGLLKGTFGEWELALAINQIHSTEWKLGHEHIGQVIAEIERDLASGTSEVTPEAVTTDNVIKLFDRAPIVQASMASLSQTVSLHVDVFARLGQPNEIVPIFETLKTLPQTANQISSIIAAGQSTEDGRTALALEVGRLRAEIAQLKADLEAAHSAIEQLSKRPWWKKTSVLLAGSVIPAIATGVWVLSGDDKALEERWNKLAVDLEFLSSKIWPDANEQIIQEFRFELPDGVDV